MTPGACRGWARLASLDTSLPSSRTQTCLLRPPYTQPWRRIVVFGLEELERRLNSEQTEKITVHAPLYDCHNVRATTGSAEGGGFLEAISVRSIGKAALESRRQRKFF